jgi:hypothetical protein
LLSSYQNPRSFDPRLLHHRARVPRSIDSSEHFPPFFASMFFLLDIPLS